MFYIILFLSITLKPLISVTPLEKTENENFVCNVNDKCSGAIVKYKGNLFFYTASHCVSFKQDRILCGYKGNSKFDFELELTPTVLACSDAARLVADIDDFAIYGINKAYPVGYPNNALKSSLVPALIQIDSETQDDKHKPESYFVQNTKGDSISLKGPNVIECRAAGFGRLNEEGSLFGELRTTKIPSKIQEQITIQGNWIIATFKGDSINKTILFHGDSGGPLYCKLLSDKSAVPAWFIMGVAASMAGDNTTKTNRWSLGVGNHFINELETAYFQSYPTACVKKDSEEKIFTQQYNKRLYSNRDLLMVSALRNLAEYQGVHITSRALEDGSTIIASQTTKYLFIKDCIVKDEGEQYSVTIKYTDKPVQNSEIVKITSKILASKNAGEKYCRGQGDFCELEFINSSRPKITMKDCVIVNDQPKIEIGKESKRR